MTLSFLDHFRTRNNATRAMAPSVPVQVFDGLAQVRAYWEGVRSRGVLPSRAALDPRGFGNVLDRVFLADRIGRGLVQVRVAGSGLAGFAGTDLRGLPLSCIFAAESRPILAQVLENVFQFPAVAELDLGSDRGARGVVMARILLLPLAPEGGTPQLLGAISFAPADHGGCKLQIMARREEVLLSAVSPDAVPAPAQPTQARRLTLVRNEP